MNNYIRNFDEISIKDIGLVGGKNASLGEMYSRLNTKGVSVPGGFATSSNAFEEFLLQNNLKLPLRQLMNDLERPGYGNLRETGAKARALISEAVLSPDFINAIRIAYYDLCGDTTLSVAVRSSATAEDLPEASFAGQHESFLNVKGFENVVTAIKKCFTSLYTDRAIKYREDNHFDHEKVALSAGVQLMVRSDLSSSGVAFTIEPESGHPGFIFISGVWGLGENLVQGTVTPDDFYVFKPTLRGGKNPIIQRKLGEKEKTMIYTEDAENTATIRNIETPPEKRTMFVLSDDEIIKLSEWCLAIEEHYGKPMDIEWAKDGLSGDIFILQARPETVHSRRNPYVIQEYKLDHDQKHLTKGNAVGEKVCTGIARVLDSPREAEKLNEGEIVVTDLTSPDWDPLLKKAAAIITNKGGRTSHASIVAREIGIPAVVGTGDATEVIKDGEEITVSCCEGKTGYVYAGKLDFTTREIDFSQIEKPATAQPMMIVADPDQAFRLSFYPNEGIGLMRMEFIITHYIQVHPMALAKFDQLKDESVKAKIDAITEPYRDKKQFFIDRLAQGMATIAAAFYPKDVIVRLSDFKTNEYANLIGGTEFEPNEENPMLGFRGASRYYNDRYRDGFKLECEALKRVRNEMGLTNVKIMVPFCRTLEEARKVINELCKNGLDRDRDKTLEFYMMVEIPSNVILASEFAQLFDGFSIGSNDLTQLVLGVDRDSSIISSLFSEQDDAVEYMISSVIEKARQAGIKIGLCGQAPSDFPEFARFLVKQGINSISFNPDAILKGISNISKAEKESSLAIA